MTVKNSLNFNHEDWKGKEFTMPSQTVPDQTMSIKTIMEKFAQGQPIGGTFEEIYEEEPSSGIDPRRLDLVDIQAMKINNGKRIKELQNEIQDHENEKARKKQEASTNTP